MIRILSASGIRRRHLLALIPAFLAAAVLASCSTGGRESLPGTPRPLPGDKCFISTFTYEPGDPPAMRRDIPLCTPADLTVEPDTTCPVDLNELDVETESGLDFCSTEFLLAEVSTVEGDSERIRLDLLGQDAEGRQFLLSVLEINLVEDVGGVNEGPLDTPLEYDTCNITAGIDLDAECEYRCAWLGTSEFPCGGLESFDSTEVPVTCYDDDQEGCPAPAYGADDFVRIHELTVTAFQDGTLGVLEPSMVSGEYSVTLRSAYPDGTWGEMTAAGQFRAVVASPFYSLPPDELTPCDPCVP